MHARLLAVSVLLGVAASAQPPQSQADAIAAMELSIARQRASVEAQQASIRQVSHSFGTMSWPVGTGVALNTMQPVAAVESLEPVETAAVGCAPISPSQLTEFIGEVAEREGLTPELLRAVIQRESAFYPCAISSKGAQGLMQLMPGTAADLGVADPFDPEQNIDAGARFLGQLLTRYAGDIALALGAYNAGPARVDQYQGLPPIPETLNYVSRIMEELRVPKPSTDAVQGW